MVSLSWIDIQYLTKEFNSQLEGAKIENIYGNHEELHIKLYKTGQKNLFLSAFLSNGVVVINDSKFQHNPKNIFIQFLRKYLKNSILENCISYTKERVLTLKFMSKNQETKEFEKRFLHIELFMGGQIYLCNSKNEILKKLKHFTNEIKNSSQSISSSNNESNSLMYQIPDKKTNTLEISYSQLETSKTLQESIKFLGLGKKYVQYLSIMTNIPLQTQISELKNCDIEAVEKIISTLLNYSIAPTFLKEYNCLLPFNPYELHPHMSEKISLKVEKLSASYSKELVKVHGKEFFPKQNSNKEPAKLSKLKKRLSEQEKNLNKISTQSTKFESQAGKIYENYSELKELQNKINEVIVKDGFKTLKSKIQENETLKKIITSVDEKNKNITINVDAIENLKQ